MDRYVHVYICIYIYVYAFVYLVFQTSLFYIATTEKKKPAILAPCLRIRSATPHGLGGWASGTGNKCLRESCYADRLEPYSNELACREYVSLQPVWDSTLPKRRALHVTRTPEKQVGGRPVGPVGTMSPFKQFLAT